MILPLLAIAAFLMSVAAAAQEPIPEVYPGAIVAWDPFDDDAVRKTTHYEFRHADSVPWRKVGLTRRWPVPTVLEGTYDLQIRACRNTSCSGPAALRVRILLPDSLPTPGTPKNFLPICREP